MDAFVLRSHKSHKWKGVPTLVYKHSGSGFSNILRRNLFGTEKTILPFQVRYFEIGRGGYSSLERHDHIHVVIVVRGQGRVFLKDRVYSLKPFDSIYIGKTTIHQFHQVGRTPFGFFCIVSTKRDKPVLIRTPEIKKIIRKNPQTKRYLKS